MEESHKSHRPHIKVGKDEEKKKCMDQQTFWLECYLYLYRRECVCVCVCVCPCVCVSFRRYTCRRLWSDRDQILHTHTDSSPNGSELNKNQPRVTQGGFGGF